jgi:hypothetical protein
MRKGLVATIAVLAASVAAVPSHAGPATGAKPVELLPDPAQAIPRVLTVEAADDGSGGWRLGFLSGVLNAGRGPLTVYGSRPDTSGPTMTAVQMITRSDGSTVVGPKVGDMRFVSTPTHDHWHFIGFEHYQLRRASDGKFIGPGRKTGFCLTDSFHDAGDAPLPGEPEQPVYTDRCGLSHPELLQVTEGISVGWMDLYDPLREGQYVDLTGVPAGRYWLIHSVNVDKRIREVSRSNNASSLLISLSWPQGPSAEPVVKTLASCFYATRCYDHPPKLTPGQARTGAVHAASLIVRGPVKHARTRCRPSSGLKVACSVAWRRSGVAWTAAVRLSSELAKGVPQLRYSGHATGRPLHCTGGCHAVTHSRGGVEPA